MRKILFFSSFLFLLVSRVDDVGSHLIQTTKLSYGIMSNSWCCSQRVICITSETQQWTYLDLLSAMYIVIRTCTTGSAAFAKSTKFPTITPAQITLQVNRKHGKSNVLHLWLPDICSLTSLLLTEFQILRDLNKFNG